MECKLLLFSILALSVELIVTSGEEENKAEEHQFPDFTSFQGPLQQSQNENYQLLNNIPNAEFPENKPEQWPESHILSQHQQHLNYPRPHIVNGQQPYYHGIPSPIPQHSILHNTYNTQQSYGDYTPQIQAINHIAQQFSSPENLNNLPLDRRNDQNWNQQNAAYNSRRSFNTNARYNYRDPYMSYGNYGYLQHQPTNLLGQHQPGPINSNPDTFYSYGQSWPPQNQYHHIQNAMGYSPWPEQEIKYGELPNGRPSYPPYVSEIGDGIAAAMNSIPIPAQQEYQEGHAQTVPLEQPVTIDSKSSNRYVVVYKNGTFEQVNSFNFKDIPDHVLAILEVKDKKEDIENDSIEYPFDTGISKIPQDNNNNWHIYTQDNFGTPIQTTDLPAKSHESLINTQNTSDDIDMSYFKPEHLMPIQSTTEQNIETVTKTTHSATETENYDSSNEVNDLETEHLTLQQATDSNKKNIITNTSQKDMHTYGKTDLTTTDTSYEIPKTIPVQRYNNTLTNSKDIVDTVTYTKYPSSEYILSIQSLTDITETETTKKPIEYSDSITNLSSNHNTLPTSSNSGDAENCSEGEWVYVGLNNDTSVEPSEEGLPGYNYRNPIDYGTDQIPVKAVPSSTDKTSIKNDRNTTSTQYENDYILDINDGPDALPQSANDNEPLQPETGNGKKRRTKKLKRNIDYKKIVPKDASKFRDDLKIDPSEIKSVVDKPVIWFRPDAKFWDKVTKGENSYDYLSIYDVHCQPKLIEKHTTIHHYPNGTDVVDYMESFWDSINDLNPKEVKSNRVVIHPSEEP